MAVDVGLHAFNKFYENYSWSSSVKIEPYSCRICSKVFNLIFKSFLLLLFWLFTFLFLFLGFVIILGFFLSFLPLLLLLQLLILLHNLLYFKLWIDFFHCVVQNVKTLFDASLLSISLAGYKKTVETIFENETLF